MATRWPKRTCPGTSGVVRRRSHSVLAVTLSGDPQRVKPQHRCRPDRSQYDVPLAGRTGGPQLARQIFVSYSHADEDWLKRLLTTLAPLARRDEIDVWADTMIMPGENWRIRIEDQIERSNVAVLLVSAAFLSSEFINEAELPLLVEGAGKGRLTLIWIPVSASLWDQTPLSELQAALDPNQPLDQMSNGEAQQALVTLARRIAGGRTLTDVGRAMDVIDQAYDAVAEEAGEQPRTKPFRVRARHTGTSVAFEEGGDPAHVVEVITAKDLENLPEEEHRLVQAFSKTMYNEYERWTELRPRRSVLTAFERAEYEAAGREMCKELHHILDFLEFQLGKHLQDHYHGVRYACDKLVALTS